MSEDPARTAVDLGKPADPAPRLEAPEPAFDPYRFGRPDHPVPAEYAPPGYVPDAYPTQSPPYGPPPGWPGPAYPGGPQHAGPPPNYATAHRQQGNGKAVAALVLGILSIVMCWLTIFNAIFIVLALIFGLLALGDARRKGGTGRGMAIAGLVCLAAGTAATVIYTVWALSIVNQCGGVGNTGDSSFSQCVRDRI